MVPAACERNCTRKAIGWAAGASGGHWPLLAYGPRRARLCCVPPTPTERARRAEPIAGPARTYVAQPSVGGRHHLLAPAGWRLAVSGHLARPLLAQNCGLWCRRGDTYDVREAMPETLVSEALRRALAVRQPVAGLVVHCNQGSQYVVTNFKALAARREAVQSMLSLSHGQSSQAYFYC